MELIEMIEKAKKPINLRAGLTIAFPLIIFTTA
jgi:hypothetical protein